VTEAIHFLDCRSATAGAQQDTARRFLAALSSAPLGDLVRNVRAALLAIEDGATLLPLTVSRAGDEGSYVCSPYASYVSYAREELPKLGNRALEAALSALIRASGLALGRGRIDDVVFVNNWLLSTNLYPRWEADRLEAITARCIERWPDHAVAFRSLNAVANPELIERLGRAGYALLPSRQVYLFDGRSGEPARRSNTRTDLALLSRRDYEIVGHDAIEASDLPRLEALYGMLYLDKYSLLNPQYTARFMGAGLETRWLRFTALRAPNGVLDGVLGTFELDGVLTAPVVGYDTGRPRALALYRRLMALVLRETLERGMLLNLSSGAAGFKRLRGGRPSLEYTAVYVRHLPARRRAVWRGLGALVGRVGVPLLTRYQL
jgi:hypothetical protein